MTSINITIMCKAVIVLQIMNKTLKHTQIGHAILNITLALISKSHPPLISCKNHIIVQIP